MRMIGTVLVDEKNAVRREPADNLLSQYYQTEMQITNVDQVGGCMPPFIPSNMATWPVCGGAGVVIHPLLPWGLPPGRGRLVSAGLVATGWVATVLVCLVGLCVPPRWASTVMPPAIVPPPPPVGVEALSMGQDPHLIP